MQPRDRATDDIKAQDVRSARAQGAVRKVAQFAGWGAAVAAVTVIVVGSPHVSAIDSREKMRQEAAEQSAKAGKAFEAIMQQGLTARGTD